MTEKKQRLFEDTDEYDLTPQELTRELSRHWRVSDSEEPSTQSQEPQKKHDYYGNDKPKS